MKRMMAVFAALAVLSAASAAFAAPGRAGRAVHHGVRAPGVQARFVVGHRGHVQHPGAWQPAPHYGHERVRYVRHHAAPVQYVAPTYVAPPAQVYYTPEVPGTAVYTNGASVTWYQAY